MDKYLFRKTNARIVGHKIREFRVAQGLTQRELGDAVGVNATQVSGWETGRGVPRRRTIELIAQALNCRLSELTGNSNDDIAPVETECGREIVAAEVYKVDRNNASGFHRYFRIVLGRYHSEEHGEQWVTWESEMCVAPNGQRHFNYWGGHYFKDEQNARKDYRSRLAKHELIKEA